MHDNNIGRKCGHEIKVSIFRGGDYCSVNCEKADRGEKAVPSRAS